MLAAGIGYQIFKPAQEHAELNNSAEFNSRPSQLEPPTKLASARPPAHSAPRPHKDSTTSAPAPTLSSNPLAPRLAVAHAACQSEILASFGGEGSCENEVMEFRDRLEDRLQRFENKGIHLDRALCVATDRNGTSTHLDSVSDSLFQLTRAIAKHPEDFSPEKEANDDAFRRLNVVALCSVMKVIDYWTAHPNELPPPEHIQDYLYFDIQSGKPQESFMTGTFLRTLATWQKLKG